MAAKDYLELQRQRAAEALERALANAALAPEALAASVRVAAFADGRLLLPVLALAASEAVASASGDPAAAMAAATAIGLLDAAKRLRAATLSAGTPASPADVLAADALQALAFGAVAAPASIPPERAVRLSAVLQQAALAAASALAAPPESPASDPLFAAAAELGAVAGGAPSDEVATLKAFGAELGIAHRLAGESGKDATIAFHAREAAARLMDIPGSLAAAALSSIAENIKS